MSHEISLKRIGEILVEQQLISESDQQKAAALQMEVGGLFGQLLVKTGSIAEADLVYWLGRQLAIDVLDPEWTPPPVEDLRAAAHDLKVDLSWLQSKQAILWIDQDQPDCSRILHFASTNPADIELQERLDAISTRLNPNSPADGYARPHFATRPQIEDLYGELAVQDSNPLLETSGLSAQKLREMAEEAPVIEFVNRLFSQSLRLEASDIHLEPFENHFDVRFRIDGVLQSKGRYPTERFRAITSRIKLLSNMDIAEQRLPQDGRQSIRVAGETVDLRVSSLPGSWGESLVLRLLRKEQTLPDLKGLGLVGKPARIIHRSTQLQNGIVLVTGPTGSGKSTTLYRLLNEANTGTRKIVTVEDPIEYDIKGVVQVQTKPDIGLNFASTLRSILRQDPDIIMVGEIRDGETAAIAAQASLTGHLVYSTLHTNSALASIDRLLDLGLERFLVASALRIVAAQRLVRRLCDACAVPADSRSADQFVTTAIRSGMPEDHLADVSWKWKSPTGCKICDYTGYRGRLAAFEACDINLEMQQAILNGASGDQLLAVARQQGFISLFEDGLHKAADGLTSIDEIVRVIAPMEIEDTTHA